MVARLTAVSGDKTRYVTVTAELDVSIQRLADEKAVMIGEAVGKTFKMFAEEDADIEVGDKLVDENGYEYKVRSVNIPAQLGNFVHLEIILVKVK